MIWQTALLGRELEPWPVPSPRSPTARQEYHRQMGLTSCSTLWAGSGDCLEFLLLLKADMLEGQVECNQIWTGDLIMLLSWPAFPEKVRAAASGRTDTFPFQNTEPSRIAGVRLDKKSLM